MSSDSFVFDPIPRTGLNKIDALIDQFGTYYWADNKIQVSFSSYPDSVWGNDTPPRRVPLTDVQQAQIWDILHYATDLTGVQFVPEGTSGVAHTLYVGLYDLSDAGGKAGVQIIGDNGLALITIDPDVVAQGNDFAIDTVDQHSSRQTVLHELGHVLGLKHPFELADRLPTNEDFYSNTLMSYTRSPTQLSNFNYFSPYDLLALEWIYGRDGIGGTYGWNSAKGPMLRASTTAFNDAMTMDGPRAQYALKYDTVTDTVHVVNNGFTPARELVVSGVDVLKFADGKVAQVVPDANERELMQLAQAFFGPDGFQKPGLPTGLYEYAHAYLDTRSIGALAADATQAYFAGKSADYVASTILANLGLTSQTIPTTYGAVKTWVATTMFATGSAARGSNLPAALDGLASLESDPMYGGIAAAFNDHVNTEWFDHFAENAVTLAGVPSNLVEYLGG